ncbi:MAG: hypothetical protein SNH88_03540 [Rikenellaceae bacterium]
MNLKKLFLPALALVAVVAASAAPIESIETPYTISLVRSAKINKKPYIVASSYDGVVLCYDYNGKMLWENKLSGYFNQDIYCGDLNGDGSDETLAANSNGTLYCLDEKGNLMWEFSTGETPVGSACIINKGGKAYAVCGGYDMNLHYLDAKGKLISTINSSSYSKEKGFGLGGPEIATHIINYVRPFKRANGSEALALHGVINSMSAKGGLYLFEPLASTPYQYYSQKVSTVIGAMSVNNLTGGGDKILLGSTKDTRGGYILEYDPAAKKDVVFSNTDLAASETNKFGYRVTQSEVMLINGKPQHINIFGSIIMMPTYTNTKATTKVLVSKYAYNDMTKDATSTKLILASEQGGGNCIHIFDVTDPAWEKAYEELVPKGNITSILESSADFRAKMEAFKVPSYENLNARPKVYFMSESPNRDPNTKAITDKIHASYPSPIFLNGGNSGGSEKPELWKRDTMPNAHFRDRRDRRQKYQNSQDKILANVAKAYEGDSKGMSMWGGHGNDPFYYSPETQRKMMDLTGDDQQTVLIFPEMEGRGKDMEWIMDAYFYPLASYAREHNTKLFIRSKHIFWLGNIYEPHWEKLVSGEYADVFVPSMEETTDKSMELSVMGRMGMWMSGAVDSWGSRCARDNPSYNRLRQHDHQQLPNGFLRNMIYHISLGAQYLDNFKVDQEYMSLLWEMIARGLLFVPERDEIVSLSPVRMTILEPDQAWLDEGNNVKWTVLYDKKAEAKNQWAIGRLNGTWPAAPTTEWDFSRYAAGATERRVNFISSYNNGHVMFTPPFDKGAKRGSVEQYLHPIYKGKTKEFFTDGRYYYSDAKMSKKYSPKEYYKEVERAIIESSAILPVTVKGEVGWVAAQSAPKHLRLTVIDGGYIDPSEKQATIKIGAAKVKSITDLVTGEQLKISGGESEITIPCGMFRFFDIELEEDLK